MDEMKRFIEEKQRELQGYFDRMIEAGCTCTVLQHELLPGKARTVDNYPESRAGAEMVATFVADALIVLRAVPVIDGAGNIAKWRFRLYFRPTGWDDSFHNHHRFEVVDYRMRSQFDSATVTRPDFIYVVGAGDYSMFVQSFGGDNIDPDDMPIVQDSRDWRAYKRERAEHFERLETLALDWELRLMEDEDDEASLHD